MQRALGDDFKLIGTHNLDTVLDDTSAGKEWLFTSIGAPDKAEVRSIVAKSDYLRMKVVGVNGGYWIDADSIVLRNFTEFLEPKLSNGSLLWHSEQLFGAVAGNELLNSAAAAMVSQQRQVWGNPGGIKDLVKSNPDLVSNIDFKLVSPGWSPEYSFKNQEIMLDPHLPVGSFLLNSEQQVLKLYNTALSDSGLAELSVSEFLDSRTLLSRIFLALEDRDYWIDMSERFIESHF